MARRRGKEAAADVAADEDEAAARRGFFPWFRLTVGALCLAGLVALLFAPQFMPWVLRFEHATADWRTALLSDQLPGPHPDIAVVSITPATLRDYANSPIDRGLLARTISAIDRAGAKVIALDIYFLKATDAGKDQLLVDTLKNARAKIVLGAWDERGQMENFQRSFQKSFLERIGHPAGYLNLRHQRDDVVRYRASSHPGSDYEVSFARLIARAAGHDDADSERPIAWLLPPDDGRATYLTLPAHTIVAGEHDTTETSATNTAKPLDGKIVLIGGDFPDRDKHRTPLSSWSSERMSGVYIHANMIADLIDPRRSIAELPPSTARNLVAVVAVVSCLIGWLMWQSSIVQYIGYTFATGALVLIDAVVYREFRLLLPITLILAAWFLGVTGGRALRFFVHWFIEKGKVDA